MDEPRSISGLRTACKIGACKIGVVAAFNCAVAVSLAAGAERNAGGGALRELLAQGWNDESVPDDGFPPPRIVRPAANLINAIPASVLLGNGSGAVESCAAQAKPTLVELISQRSPKPQAKIIRPAAKPLPVPLPAPKPPLRVAEPFELEPIGWGDQGMPEPVTLEVATQIPAIERPADGPYELGRMLLGDGLAVDPP